MSQGIDIGQRLLADRRLMGVHSGTPLRKSGNPGRLPRSGEVIVSGGRETSNSAPREQREK
jgi:hypothetical protein